MLTLLAQSTMALTLSLPVTLDAPQPTIHEAVERAVDREWASVTMDHSGRGHAEARIGIGYYFGILAFDWVSTDIATGAQDYGEMNPLPLMGTRVGRAVTMSVIAAGWTLLDRTLVAHGHTRTAKALRVILGAYGANIVSWNLGLQRAWTPDMLLPGQWQRDAAKPKDYAALYGQSQNTQRAYDACKFMSAHRKGSCWK